MRSTDRTGVEMEALTAVSVAALTLYDMIKAVDPAARIDDIRVLRKEGGKTGHVGAADDAMPVRAGHHRLHPRRGRRLRGPLRPDDRRLAGAAGLSPCRRRSWWPTARRSAQALHAAIGEDVDVIITSGGTGISPTDGTADATADMVDYQIPGLADAIRRVRPAAGADVGAVARRVRGAGTDVDREPARLTGGVRDGLGVLADVLDHALDQLAGKDHSR